MKSRDWNMKRALICGPLRAEYSRPAVTISSVYMPDCLVDDGMLEVPFMPEMLKV